MRSDITMKILVAVVVLLVLPIVLTWLPPVRGIDLTFVKGTSMEPTYIPGQIVMTKESDDYEIGDVLMIEAPTGEDEWFHRYVQDQEDGRLITIGDAQAKLGLNAAKERYEVETIDREDILGKAIFATPKFGGATRILVAPLALKAMPVIFLGLLWVIFDLMHRNRLLQSSVYPSSENTP